MDPRASKTRQNPGLGTLKGKTLKYRFTPEDFLYLTTEEDSEGYISMIKESLARLCSKQANAKLELWESESEKIYGFWDSIAKKLRFWTPRGPAKLKREDFTHIAYIWNPKPFEEKK